VPAFVFPGQGSQRSGMGRAWVDHPSWEVVRDASEVTGRDLAHLLLDASAEELTETRNAQLATVTQSLMVLDAVERVGIEPTICAGHSVGEYTALIASGALGFEDGLRLVAERGEAMQEAADARPGIMSVVAGCDAEVVDVSCRLADGNVWLANYNSATETVIAGEAESVARATRWAQQLGGATVHPVAVNGAFHTPLMAPARHRVRKALAGLSFHAPEIPVVANVDALPHDCAGDWDLLLSAQLCAPVRWRQSLIRLGGLTTGGDTEHVYVELGPGGALSTMIRQTLPTMRVVSVSAPDDLDTLVDEAAGNTALRAFAARHQGEHLYVSERMVIAPGAGQFQPAEDSPANGATVEVGSLLGTVGGQEVRSPFSGWLMGMLAHPGERVQSGQPIAWLRVS
jgi:[acyl-carrier-protein] S-malonyltransferase